MSKTFWKILAVCSVFGLIVGLRIMKPQAEQDKVESQSCLTNKDPLMTTLPRYNDAYHGLTDGNEKEDLARLYLAVISKDILVLPPKQDLATVRVVLPVKKDGNATLVLREIQLGSDNGLHDAFQQRKYKRRWRHEPPPFHSSKIEKLINRIISGCGEV